ncbi:MAG TPA: zinc ribbon domain-containing protein [Thermodesulfobacteriota bacterium]|nr:zinc ribbon domain-containing protein [Thermodesulfobacteriota bacterium]
MPIYEYRCSECGWVFEVIQKFSDKPVKKCVHCSGKKVEKLISQSSFVLKGGGWYKTDYADKADKSRGAEKESKESAEAPKKPDCSTCPSR